MKTKTNKQAYDALVTLAEHWANPKAPAGFPPSVPSALAGEVHREFLYDPEPMSTVLDGQEQNELVALYILFYAAAKLNGDL
jgi:hypothetical protein